MVTPLSTAPSPSPASTIASPERDIEPLLERSDVRKVSIDNAWSPPPADMRTNGDAGMLTRPALDGMGGSLSAGPLATQTDLQKQSSDAQGSRTDAHDSLQHAVANFDVAPAGPVPALVGLGVIPKGEYRFSEKLKSSRLRRSAIRTHGSGSPHR